MANGRKTGGKQKGTPNKATLAAQRAAAQQVIDRSMAGKQELAIHVLEKLMKVAEGATSLHRPTTSQELQGGATPNPDGDWDKFGQWFDRTVHCAQALANYQSPKFKTITAYMAPATPPDPAENARQIDAKVVDLNDPVELQRIYRLRIGAVKG